MKKTANPSQEELNQGSRPLIWFGAVWIAVMLLPGALFGHEQWVAAQIRNHGRTVPAQILRVEDELGGDGSATVEYTFTLPSGQRRVDRVQAAPRKVEEALGVSPSGAGEYVPSQSVPSLRFLPTTVRYVPGEPSLHRLQGFESSAGSPLGGYVLLGMFVCFGGLFLGAGLQMRQQALAAAPSGGHAPPPGLTKPLVTEPLAESGSLSGFTYRREGQCFVLTPARHTVSKVLMMVMGVSLLVVMFGMVAFAGAFMVQSSWLAWHGIDGFGVTINGSLPSQAGTPAIVGVAVIGAGLFLFGFVPAAAAVWATGENLCFGARPCVLDRGRGEFRVGPRVVCGLGDIARLHLRRGHNPDDPALLPDARYYGSVVLRDGRQVPLGLSARNSKFQRLPETELGDGIAGGQIESVMAAAAAFLGVEYVLTGGPDNYLRNSGDC